MLSQIFINAPYNLLVSKYLPFFLEKRINPEIYFDAEILDKFPKDEFEALAKELHQHQIKITFHAPYVDLAPGAIDHKIRQVTEERLRQLLDLVPIFKPVLIVAHAAYDEVIYETHEEQWLNSSINTWNQLLPLAERFKVLLTLENVFEPNPKTLIELFKHLKSHYLGFCFDIGHQHAFTKTKISDWLTLFPYLKQVHLHDNHGLKDEHLGLGKGDIDFAYFFRLLIKHKILPLITLEPHTEQAFWDSLDYLDKLPKDIKRFLKKGPTGGSAGQEEGEKRLLLKK